MSGMSRTAFSMSKYNTRKIQRLNPKSIIIRVHHHSSIIPLLIAIPITIVIPTRILPRHLPSHLLVLLEFMMLLVLMKPHS